MSTRPDRRDPAEQHVARGAVRYVVLVHEPTGRAYSLSAAYALLEEEVAPEVVARVRRSYDTYERGWAPTWSCQKSWWANFENLPPRDFTAYWPLSATAAAELGRRLV